MHRPRVAFLGNMNNNHFAMARYLRDHNIDAEVLLIDGSLSHFHPSCDAYSLDYMDFCKSIRWGSSRVFLKTSKEEITSDLNGYDVLIGAGIAPAYLNKVGMCLDIFVPYGGDIWTETFYGRLAALRNIPSFWSGVYHQKRGIPECKIFHMSGTNPLYEGQWMRYGGRAIRWIEGIPAVYAPMYAPEKLPYILSRSHWGDDFSKIRAQCDLMVFSHGRHVWGNQPGDPSLKGTEKLLRGWARFIARNPKVNAKLVTLEYGKDVECSKQLIKELGIHDSIAWFPLMYRKDLMVGLLQSDIVCAEFENSWMTSGIIYEAQVGHKPIMAYRDDNIYRKDYPNLYPIMNAREPEEIADKLEAYVQNPDVFKEMGQAGYEWYQREVVEKSMSRYLDYIYGKK